MNTKFKVILIPGLSATFVAALFVGAALWVNGNFPLPIALSIAVALGAGTYLVMAKSSTRKSQ